MAVPAPAPVKVKVLEVKELSEEDSEYISSWMAASFAGRDAFNYLWTGKTYEEDPLAHKLMLRGIMDRGSLLGSTVISEDRNGFRILYRPGQVDKIYDLDWESSKDEAWNAFLERCGGKEAVRKRAEKLSKAVHAKRISLYGPDGGLSLFRSNNFATKQDCQGKGIGRAIHDYVCAQAKEAGVTYFFGTFTINVPLYEHLGCRDVTGKPIPTGLTYPNPYPAGNDFQHIMQYDP